VNALMKVLTDGGLSGYAFHVVHVMNVWKWLSNALTQRDDKDYL
jgi:hypothetical protein